MSRVTACRPRVSAGPDEGKPYPNTARVRPVAMRTLPSSPSRLGRLGPR
jgi:hypothetical protein